MDIERLYEEWLMVAGQEARQVLGAAAIVGAREFKEFVADWLHEARARREAQRQGGTPPDQRPWREVAAEVAHDAGQHRDRTHPPRKPPAPPEPAPEG
jgi:hypothetical protein